MITNRGLDRDLCSMLERTRSGLEASQMSPSASSRLHILPAFLWSRPSPGAVGRKELGGAELPIAISWEGGLVQEVEIGAERAVSWTARGLGLNRSGVSVLKPGSPRFSFDALHDVPGEVWSPAVPVTAGDIGALHDDGERATWDAIAMLEPRIRDAVRRASTAIAREVSDDDGALRMIDDEQIEAVVTRVAYGSSGGHGRLWRSIQRCSDPSSTAEVDPVRYLLTRIRRDADDEVRVEMGDPRIGQKVRRVARELGVGTSLAEIIFVYNERYPADHLSRRRAINALTVSSRVEADALSWDFERSEHA